MSILNLGCAKIDQYFGPNLWYVEVYLLSNIKFLGGISFSLIHGYLQADQFFLPWYNGIFKGSSKR